MKTMNKKISAAPAELKLTMSTLPSWSEVPSTHIHRIRIAPTGHAVADCQWLRVTRKATAIDPTDRATMMDIEVLRAAMAKIYGDETVSGLSGIALVNLLYTDIWVTQRVVSMELRAWNAAGRLHPGLACDREALKTYVDDNEYAAVYWRSHQCLVLQGKEQRAKGNWKHDSFLCQIDPATKMPNTSIIRAVLENEPVNVSVENVKAVA